MGGLYLHQRTRSYEFGYRSSSAFVQWMCFAQQMLHVVAAVQKRKCAAAAAAVCVMFSKSNHESEGLFPSFFAKLRPKEFQPSQYFATYTGSALQRVLAHHFVRSHHSIAHFRSSLPRTKRQVAQRHPRRPNQSRLRRARRRRQPTPPCPAQRRLPTPFPGPPTRPSPMTRPLRLRPLPRMGPKLQGLPPRARPRAPSLRSRRWTEISASSRRPCGGRKCYRV